MSDRDWDHISVSNFLIKMLNGLRIPHHIRIRLIRPDSDRFGQKFDPMTGLVLAPIGPEAKYFLPKLEVFPYSG